MFKFILKDLHDTYNIDKDITATAVPTYIAVSVVVEHTPAYYNHILR